MKKQISVNGINTGIKIRDGCNPAIVCIHGNSLSKDIFDPLFLNERLKKYTILSYDLPGHGESARPLNPEEVYCMAGYARHLEELLNQLGLSRVVLLGFSFGGHLALEAAGNNIESSVAGLCSIGAPPLKTVQNFESAFIPLPEGASLWVEEISSAQRKIIVDQITAEADAKARVFEAIRISDPKSRKFLFQSIAAGKTHCETAFIEAASIPLMFCYGEHDKIVNFNYIDRPELQKVFRQSRRDIKNAEHLPSFTGVDDFIDELCGFMESLVV